MPGLNTHSLITTLALSATEEGEELNPLVPHPIEIVLSLVVFGLLYLAVRKYVVPNFEKTFSERTSAIEGGLAEAERKQKEADARLAELEQRLGEARHEAARIREEAREQGAAIVAEMREQAQTESARIVEHGKSQIEAERQQAVTSLRAEVGTLATSLAGRIVGESLEDDERSNRVVERFLADLETLESARTAPGTEGTRLMQMRGPSAQALGSLEEQLGQAVDEVGTRKAATVGDDLFGLSQIIRTTPSLRRVLTDVSVEGEAKAALVRDLFDGKVDTIALDLAIAAVGVRWSATRDLPDALEHLSEIAVARSAGDNVDRVVDELFTVAQVVGTNPELRDALADPARSVDDKAVLIDGLLGGKALAATVTLVKQSLAGTYRSLSAALATYQQVAARVQQQGVATVVAAQPLADADRTRLEAALSRQYGRAVHLNVRVDPELMGGIRVEIGDDVIDGTVVSRLAEARRRLAG